MSESQESREVTMVRDYLRGQNLEQLGRTDEAVALYEQGVQGAFDSTGPYDRLIAIYASRAAHGDVVRVAEAALAHVHTYADKRRWYEQMRSEATKRIEGSGLTAAPRRS